MSRVLLCMFAFTLGISPRLGTPFELVTHGEMTRRAYENSALKTTDQLKRLGLVDLQVPFANW